MSLAPSGSDGVNIYAFLYGLGEHVQDLRASSDCTSTSLTARFAVIVALVPDGCQLCEPVQFPSSGLQYCYTHHRALDAVQVRRRGYRANHALFVY